MKEGLAGKIAKSFIGSKLTVLLMIVFMVIGVYSSFLIPREENGPGDVKIIQYPTLANELRPRTARRRRRVRIVFLGRRSQSQRARRRKRPSRSCAPFHTAHPDTDKPLLPEVYCAMFPVLHPAVWLPG